LVTCGFMKRHPDKNRSQLLHPARCGLQVCCSQVFCVVMEQHQLIPEPELQHFNNIQIKIQDYFLEGKEAGWGAFCCRARDCCDYRTSLQCVRNPHATGIHLCRPVNETELLDGAPPGSWAECVGRFSCLDLNILRMCIQKFPDWPPGARTANGTALCC
jgi:hypothetical protein